ncbi:MAG TPA: hypothetical protein VLD38_05270, partial [Nitrosopumilaceae archaeon]|nr:hypothetical protein [Nitrosopumilaceae archaeon]
IEFPFSINGNGFALNSYSNKILPNQIFTGDHTSLKLILNDASGVHHVGMYTNLSNLSREIPDSDTYFIYNKDKPLEINDPHGIFSNVDFSFSKDGTKNVFVFDLVFAKAMEKSDIIFRVWDGNRNSIDLKILDAWQVTESVRNEKLTKEDLSIPENDSNSVKLSLQKEPMDSLIPIIEKWAVDSPDVISDAEFLNNFGINGEKIPSWVKQTSVWVVNGDTSMQEFVDALQYLDDHGIIK